MPDIPTFPIGEYLQIKGVMDIGLLFALSLCFLWGSKRGLFGAVSVILGLTTACAATCAFGDEMAKLLAALLGLEGAPAKWAGWSLTAVCMFAVAAFVGMGLHTIARRFFVTAFLDAVGGGAAGLLLGMGASLALVSFLRKYPWGQELLGRSSLMRYEAQALEIWGKVQDWLSHLLGEIF